MTICERRSAMRSAMILLAMLLLIGGRADAEPAIAPKAQHGFGALFVEAQAGAERVVREIPAGLSNAQVWGIAAGIVAGAFVADMLGAGGLVTLGLAAAGGATGNWLLSM
jgi:hypothetical protein